MNKLSRLFLRRLERIARREAQRNAHLNGLLSLKIVEVGGHVLRRYSPAFETASLSGDHDRDVAWVRRNFGGYLLPPPQQADIVTTEGKSPTSFLPSLYRLGQVTANDHVAAIDHKRRAYAVGLVGRAGHRWSATSSRPLCWPVRSRTVVCRLSGSSVLLPCRRQSYHCMHRWQASSRPCGG